VPAVDLRGLGRREWRGAGLAALVVHAVMLGGIVLLGSLGIGQFVEKPRQEVVDAWVTPPESTPPDAPQPANGGSPEDGPANAGAEGGGGGNQMDQPVTQGQPPPSAVKPALPPTVVPPIPNPSLPVQTAVEGPNIDIPAPDVPGIPTGLPAPDAPSMGNGGGTGVGPGSGTGAGPGTGPGVGSGPGGPGGGPGGGTGPAARPGGDGPGTGLGANSGPPSNTPDHGPRLIKKAKPTITKAMLEHGTFGTVQIRVTVGADGRILSAEPISTLANGGTQAALEALRRCTFEPAVRNQRYVTESTVVRFEVRPN
jgi:outer membrane biosynthesis protein TonB